MRYRVFEIVTHNKQIYQKVLILNASEHRRGQTPQPEEENESQQTKKE